MLLRLKLIIMKEQIKKVIEASGLENKEIVKMLDEIRKEYHNRKNVGDKGLSEKTQASAKAVVFGKEYPLSKGWLHIFYQGAWRNLRGEKIKTFRYLGNDIRIIIKRK